jgi:hypothetical protein
MQQNRKINPKKRWFDVPDSLTKSEDGKREYFNVEARFHDHPVINVAKSTLARHNVHDFSIRLEMRVKYASGDVPAVRNATHHAIRFDKGSGLRSEDFKATMLLIQRCWDAWQHYQTFREAPISEAERVAIRLIEQRPEPSTLMVDTGNGLRAVRLDEPEEGDDDDEGDYLPDDEEGGDAGGEAAPPAPAAPKVAKPKKAAKPKAKPKRRAA